VALATTETATPPANNIALIIGLTSQLDIDGIAHPGKKPLYGHSLA
jgi:hypothetical protein